MADTNLAHVKQNYERKSEGTDVKLSSVDEIIAYANAHPGETDGDKMNRKGYTFDGWNGAYEENPTGETFELSDAEQWRVGDYEDVFLWAKWKLINYYISYDDTAIRHTNPGTKSTELPIVYSYLGTEDWYKYRNDSEPFHISTDLPYAFEQIPEAQQIKGYKITLSSSTTNDPTQILTSDILDNVIVNGSWELCTYTITYNVESGTTIPGKISSYTIETPTFSLPTPQREGYTFDYWTVGGKQISQISVGSHDDLTATSFWKANDIQMTFSNSPEYAGEISAVDTNGNQYTETTNNVKTGTQLTATITKYPGYRKDYVYLVRNDTLAKIITWDYTEGKSPIAEFTAPGYDFTISAEYTDIEGQIHFIPGY